MKAKLAAMGYKELLALINSNDTLREELWDYAMDTANFWIDECLYGLGKGTDGYEISPCSYSHFTITRSGDYLVEFDEWIHNAQSTYGFLSDEGFAIVEKFLHYADIYEHLQHVWCKDEDYYKVEDLMEDYMEKSERIICDRLTSEYDLKDVDLVDYIDEWMSNNGYEEAYVECGHIYIHEPEVVIEAHERCIA